MKESLRLGLSTTRRWVVDEARTIGFMGDEGRVYATPSLIRDIEETSREFLLGHLDEGEDSLGVHVDVWHQAPTLLGQWVDITVTVAEVNGRSVRLILEAKDCKDQIAKGHHERFIADTAQTKERLRKKAASIREPVGA